MVERWRHQNIPTSERSCTVYKSGKIENEEHFLIHCPGYELQRQIFVNKINKIVLGYIKTEYSFQNKTSS